MCKNRTTRQNFCTHPRSSLRLNSLKDSSTSQAPWLKKRCSPWQFSILGYSQPIWAYVLRERNTPNDRFQAGVDGRNSGLLCSHAPDVVSALPPSTSSSSCQSWASQSRSRGPGLHKLEGIPGYQKPEYEWRKQHTPIGTRSYLNMVSVESGCATENYCRERRGTTWAQGRVTRC